MIKPNLIVIRSSDINALADFYSLLGCIFEKHQHGNGPEHYAYEVDGIVFEIYPLLDNISTAGIRIGFNVDKIEEVISSIKKYNVGKIILEPKESPWGIRAVIDDPDGHRVELLQSIQK